MTQNDLFAILPLIVLVGWAILLLLADLWIPIERKNLTALLAALGLFVTLGLVISRFNLTTSAFHGTIFIDGFSSLIDMIFLISGLAGIALANGYLKRMEIERGEYYILLLISISGMILMTYAYDLIVVFLALELLSIPLYILAGFARVQTQSQEAALKYFLLGAFSSVFVLYGVSLVFGATAHTDFLGIISSLSAGTVDLPLFLAGAGLLLVGFSFKAAVVPFHMWSPDVYQGAPSSVTAFMSVGAKGAGFAALLRVFMVSFPSLAADMTPVFWGLAAVTMIVGNIAAIGQANIKRMLAYSSIAQSGYILMAFVPYGVGAIRNDTVAAMLFYLVTYSLATFGAWSVVIAMEKAEGKGLLINDYAGLGRKNPVLALAMAVCMLSFTGVPLTLGFWGKFYLFSTAVEGGFVGLAVVGLLASVVSAYYYLRVVVVMFMRPGEPEVCKDSWIRVTAVAAAGIVFLLSFVPSTLLNFVARAILKLQ
jgi:NADH-quinone oxidoreductase subunit N